MAVKYAGYVYLPLASLQSIAAACEACLLDNFQAHQSYSIAGRTITRANIGQVSEILESAHWAIQQKSGQIPRSSVPDMSGGC